MIPLRKQVNSGTVTSSHMAMMIYSFFFYIVQLWTMNNYHWYMKQHLDLGSNIVAFNWDVENPYVAHVLAEGKAS